MTSRLIWFVSFPLLAGPILFCLVGYLILTDPHMLNYTEGISLVHARRLLQGLPLYPDVNAWPFIYNTYPPVYPALSALMMKLFGERLFSLRLLTLLCELGILLLTYTMVRRRASSRAAGAVAVALLCAVLAVHKFHGLARLDMVLILMTVGALELIDRFESGGRNGHAYAAAALFFAALLTKPTAALMAGTAGGYCLVRACWPGSAEARKRMARATWILVAGGAMAALTYGVLTLWTGGEFFLHTVVYQAKSGRLLDMRYWTVPLMLRSYGPPILLGMLGVLFLQGHALLRAATVVSWVWYVASSLKAGADSNYSLEPLVLVIIVGCVLAVRWKGRVSSRAPAFVLVSVFFVLSVVSYRVLTPPRFRWVYNRLTLLTLADRMRLYRTMQKAEGVTLSEEPYYAARAGRAFVMSDPFQLLILARRGVFRLDPLLQALRSGRISWVLAGHRLRSHPEIHAILRSHYELQFETAYIEQVRWFVYRYKRPRPAAAGGARGN